MPSGREESRLPIGQIVTIVVALAAGGLWIYQEPLQTSRPADSGTESRQSMVPEQVPARLWQDPLAAAEEHERQDDSGTGTLTFTLEEAGSKAMPSPAFTGKTLRLSDHHGVDKLTEQISKKRPDGSTLILLVMIDGSLTPDAAETRRRDRYAVIAALGTGCFVPEDHEFIQYVRWHREETADTLVPFEWFDIRKLRDCRGEGQKPPYSHALVLWINEDRVAKEPISALRNLIAQLTTTTPKPTGRRTDEPSIRGPMPQQSTEPHRLLPVAFKIIGPRSSAVLREMLRDAWRMPGPFGPDRQGDLPLFSPWATASQEIFMVSFGYTDSQHHDWLQQQLRRAGVELQHRVLSDLKLSRSLVKELKRRGIDWDKVVDENETGDSVALISEWDTFYARTLSLQFTAAACESSDRCPLQKRNSHTELFEDLKSEENLDQLKGIKRYYYFGGLDGYKPGKGRTKPEAKPPGSLEKVLDGGTDRKETLENLERPEGDPQLDYLHRLADKIVRDDQEKRRNCSLRERLPDGCGFKAVGVFGSETYDKLLVLQALRKRLPNTIFFTTDLDVRLTHPHEYQWAHNLIIASPYGLSLEEHLQRGAPPFRDTYQTSAYFAVLRAIGRVQLEPKPSCFFTEDTQRQAGCLYSVTGFPNKRFRDTRTPRLYEVGRYGAVDLSVDPRPEHLRPYFSLGSIPIECDRNWFYFRLDRCRDKDDHDIHPPRNGPSDLRDIASASLSAFFLALPALLLVWTLLGKDDGKGQDKDQQQQRNQTCLLRVQDGRQKRGLVGLLFLLTLAWFCLTFLLAILFLFYGQEGEPLSLFEGISIWPTEAIRSLTGLLCVVFLVCGRRKLRHKADELENQFSLSEARATKPEDKTDWIDAKARWDAYRKDSLDEVRWRQEGGVVFAVVALGLVAAGQWGFPFVPLRGSFNYWADKFVLLTVGVAFVWLIAFVFDTYRLCLGFIQQLSPRQADPPGVRWSESQLKKWSEQPEQDEDFLSYRLTVELIAKWTQVIGQLVYLPFIALFLLILARSSIFEHWGNLAPLIGVWVLLASLVITSAYRLRRAAEAARRNALEQLRHLQSKAVGFDEQRNKKIQLVLDEIQAMRDGAFGSFTQRPVIGTVILALLALLQEMLVK